MFIIGTKVARSLQPFSKAHKYAHSYTATRYYMYVLGSVGTNSACPTGYEKVDEVNCGDAARSAGIVAGAGNRNGGFVQGSWPHVPVGCSIMHSELLQPSGPRPHWNRDASGANDGSYTVVCVTGVKLCLGVSIV